MGQTAAAWGKQRRSWASLKGLHPTALDLGRVALLRDAAPDALSDPARLEALLMQLGLNDEALDELPPALRPHSGAGLRVWQYPIQFAPYLLQLSRLGVRSYLEIGIRHGGSFVATAEYLQRFQPLSFAVGVDVIPCPSMEDYRRHNPRAEFWCVNTRGPEFVARLDARGPVDLVFIDSHHEEDQCRRELELLAPRAAMLALHDIANVGCPGVGRVWRELRAMADYHCFEFVAQYPDLGPFMGIGLAVRKDRMPAGAST